MSRLVIHRCDEYRQLTLTLTLILILNPNFPIFAK